ncbi:MAG TPA: TIGR00366 family protein [Candidatus Polarisedimenticolaceae bacterium]|nr:TIGR00366 family protein [Candidatus Polarisedimenticolaceae bacterium]
MRKTRFPDSLVLIFGIIVCAQLLSYVVPHGVYDRVPVEGSSRTMVADGTYHRVGGDERVRLAPWAFLTAIPEGLAAAQEIIFLVFLVGGVIALLRESGAIDAVLHGAVKRLGRAPWILIAGTLVVFGLGSFTIGMGEEYVPLIPILVTMCLAMKLDSIVAMGMIWVPYAIGWACAGTNPFGVVIAQGIAGVPITSGLATRSVLLVLFLAIGFQHVYAYARRIQRDPGASLVSDIDYSTGFDMPHDVRLDWRRIVILTTLVGGIVGFVYGVKTWGWYIVEMNAIFLGIGLAAAVLSRMTPNAAAQTFIRGAAEMTAAALLIGFARTIEVVLSQGQIIDTIIHSIAKSLEGSGSYVATLGMLGVQTICNFFIPSGSGQAYVTMPIMSPLATLTGVPQQVAVLAYQFGDGFTNMVVPTSALVMGTLALGKIPYTRWVRFVTPLLIKLFVVACIVLLAAVRFGESWGFY